MTCLTKCIKFSDKCPIRRTTFTQKKRKLANLETSNNLTSAKDSVSDLNDNLYYDNTQLYQKNNFLKIKNLENK